MEQLERIVRLGAVALVSLNGCDGKSYDTAGIVERLVIYPSSPEAFEDIHCRVNNANEIFDFYWFVNNEFKYSQVQTFSSILSNELINSGDYIECCAWTSESFGYEPYQVGAVGVYVE